MGDDQGKSGGSKLGRCCCLFLLLLLLAVAGSALYVYTSIRSMRQTKPLPFAVVERGPLEEGVLTAKFKLSELPGRLLGGDTEVSLNERELNTLLFAHASGQSEGKKAQVRLEDDSLWLEAVQPLEDGGYLNVRAHIALTLAPAQPPQIQLRGGSVGEFELGPISRPLLEAVIQQAVLEAVKREARIGAAVSFEVREGRAILRYPPGALDGQQQPPGR